MRSIGPDELKSKWPGVPIIDVRGRDEYAQAHIPGSRNIPIDEVASNLASLPPNTTMYVMCGSGKRSTRAVALFTEYGFDAVNVSGGITEWYRNGYPVTYTTAIEYGSGDGPKRASSWSLGALLNKLNRTGENTSGPAGINQPPYRLYTPLGIIAGKSFPEQHPVDLRRTKSWTLLSLTPRSLGTAAT
jgi:rhodanese-related sulfurtransferase